MIFPFSLVFRFNGFQWTTGHCVSSCDHWTMRRSLWCCCGWSSSGYSGRQPCTIHRISMQQRQLGFTFKHPIHCIKCNKLMQMTRLFFPKLELVSSFFSAGTDADTHPCTCCAGCCRTKAPWTCFFRMAKGEDIIHPRHIHHLPVMGSIVQPSSSSISF